MEREVQEKLARSLTASSVEILPYLPYLLQDLWELGSNPVDIVQVARGLGAGPGWKVLDLGCGKGAVGIRLARETGCSVKGYDLMDGFIEVARTKAEEWGVAHRCRFEVQDLHQAVRTEKDHDLTILGAVGSVLGDPGQTLKKLRGTVRPGGYLIVDDGYVLEGVDAPRLDGEYWTRDAWTRAFQDAGLKLLSELRAGEEIQSVNDDNTAAIAARAAELARLHPERRALFEEYVASQQHECEDMADRVVSAMWVLEVEAR